MVQTYEVKEATVANIKDLQRISRETFLETSSLQNGPENMKEFLDKAYAGERLKVEIEDRNSNLYFLIVNN